MGGGCWIPFCRCVNPFIKSDSRPVGGGGGGGGKDSRWAEFPRDPLVGDMAVSGGGAGGGCDGLEGEPTCILDGLMGCSKSDWL